MAIATDYKITEADIAAVNVKRQPTILRGSPTDNKDVFDQYGDMISQHFNGLCDFIVFNETANSISQSVIALYQSLGWIPPNE